MTSFQVVYHQQPYTPTTLLESQKLTLNDERVIDFLLSNSAVLQMCIDALEVLDLHFVASSITEITKEEKLAQENIAKT
jgi:hypothetical protein